MSLTLDDRWKWTQHVLQMNDTCFPKLVYKFILAGRRNVGQPRKRWEEANTHINEKSPKMAYTCSWWWPLTGPAPPLSQGTIMEITSQTRSSDVYADCTHCIQFLLENYLCICLTHSFVGTRMPWGTWQLRSQSHAQRWTCIHKPACAIPEHCDFLTCKPVTISVYLFYYILV